MTSLDHHSPSPGATLPRILVVGPSLRIMGGQAVMVERLLQAMRKDGLTVDLQPISADPPWPLRWADNVKYLRTLVCSFFYILALLRRVKHYDVIHIFSASYFSFIIAQTPAILVSRWYRKPIILNYHSGQAEDHLRRWGRIVFAILRLTDRIVVQTEFLVEVFRKFGFDAIAIPNDVDTQAFPFRERTNFQPRILVPRALEPLYNVGCAIRAFALVQRQYPAAALTILGTGPQRAELEQLVSELGLRGVTFTGRVERPDVPRYYAEHDIFLNTSSIDNMPVSVMEAYASGLPVVTTSAGGIPHMVTDRVTGHLTAIDDHAEIARRILEVLSHPEATRELVRRGHAELDKYRWEEIGPQWYALYRELAQHRRSTRSGTAEAATQPATEIS